MQNSLLHFNGIEIIIFIIENTDYQLVKLNVLYKIIKLKYDCIFKKRITQSLVYLEFPSKLILYKLFILI